MTPFPPTLTAPVLRMIEDRIDTDILFPARFLLLMDREELGQYFCYDRRIDGDGRPIDNPIDAAHARGAKIVLGGADFGCGSSREHAVWALTGFGLRCVVAESFGEIFAANCLRNGVLTVRLPRETIRALAAFAGESPLTVDLDRQRIGGPDRWIDFDIRPAHKEQLLNGWDEIDLILARQHEIDTFERAQRLHQPWLYEE